MTSQHSRRGVSTYRSYPAQLGRAVCIVGVPLMLAMAVFVPVGYPSLWVDVVFDTFAVGIALGISHIPFTALKVSSDQIRVVNWFRSHTFAVDEVKQFTMSRNIR